MVNLPGRLGSLTAHDIMTEKLVVLHEGDSLEYAATLFKEQRISGAPVITPDGIAVGVLSVTDIIPLTTVRQREAVQQDRPQSREADWDEICELLDRRDVGWRDGSELVSQRMSRRLVSVREDTALVEVARVMCDGHWHRLTVVDVHGRLVGIVSTMDVLAAIVQTADEAGS